MSRSRKRDSDELEQLRNENKELKAINKSLTRELKSIHDEFRTDKKVKERVIIQQEDDAKPRCTDCGKATLVITELGPKTLMCCNTCGKRYTRNGKKETS